MDDIQDDIMDEEDQSDEVQLETNRELDQDESQNLMEQNRNIDSNLLRSINREVTNHNSLLLRYQTILVENDIDFSLKKSKKR